MTSPAVPALVLDTNVVLDWLVFRQPAAVAIGAALEGGRYRWLMSPGMRDELARVLPRLALARWQASADRVLAACDAVAEVVADAGPTPGPAGLRCTDRDDQPFIDLAVARRCVALLSRDRAVLRLARRARPLGVVIAKPEAWPGSSA